MTAVISVTGGYDSGQPVGCCGEANPAGVSADYLKRSYTKVGPVPKSPQAHHWGTMTQWLRFGHWRVEHLAVSEDPGEPFPLARSRKDDPRQGEHFSVGQAPGAKMANSQVGEQLDVHQYR